jgi:threonine/homoserine/homoserine lactone efflux protein
LTVQSAAHGPAAIRLEMDSLPAFAALALVLTVTPGADTALVLGRAAALGTRAGLATVLGIVSGLLVWGVAAALGMAALLASLPRALPALELLGAAYLVVLGGLILHRGLAPARRAAGEPAASRSARARSLFAQGLATNLLNPKIALFYSAALPQFLTAGRPVLLPCLAMAAVHGGLSLAWLGACAGAAGRGARARGSGAARGVERVAGTALIGLGAGMGLASGRTG